MEVRNVSLVGQVVWPHTLDLEETHMEPEKHWVVEESSLPKVHAIRFHVNLVRNVTLHSAHRRCVDEQRANPLGHALGHVTGGCVKDFDPGWSSNMRGRKSTESSTHPENPLQVLHSSETQHSTPQALVLGLVTSD